MFGGRSAWTSGTLKCKCSMDSTACSEWRKTGTGREATKAINAGSTPMTGYAIKSQASRRRALCFRRTPELSGDGQPPEKHEYEENRYRLHGVRSSAIVGLMKNHKSVGSAAQVIFSSDGLSVTLCLTPSPEDSGHIASLLGSYPEDGHHGFLVFEREFVARSTQALRQSAHIALRSSCSHLRKLIRPTPELSYREPRASAGRG